MSGMKLINILKGMAGKIGFVCLTLVMVLINSTAEATKAMNENGVAVIIGNTAYKDKDIPAVDFAHRDADAMHHFVRDVLGFREENIIILKDATQAEMESTFGRKGNHRGRAFSYVRPGKSDLIVFYSGHGVPGRLGGGSYLLPTDAAIATAEINGYPLTTLYENLEKAEARSVTVFLDACFTGGSHKGPLIKKASGIQVVPQPDKGDIPFTVMTAASKDQLASWDEKARHGLFTEYLMRALYGEADKAQWGNGDGTVTLAEAQTYLNDEMRYRARRSYNREQVATVIGNPDEVLVAAAGGVFPNRPVIVDGNVEEPVASYDDLEKLDPVEGEMIALKNANLRVEPDVGSAKVGVLEKGTSVSIPGKVNGKPWYAVERDGKRIGYVYAPLLGERPHYNAPDDVVLPSGETLGEWLRDAKKRLRWGDKKAVLREARSIRGHVGAHPDLMAFIREARATRLPEDIGNGQYFPPPSPPENTPEFDGYPAPPQFRRKVENILDEMADILNRQHFNKKSRIQVACKGILAGPCFTKAESSFDYAVVNTIPGRCGLDFAIRQLHDEKISWKNTRTGRYWDARQFRQRYSNEYRPSEEVLEVINHKGKVVRRIRMFKFGEARFESRRDRDQFSDLADRLRKICQPPERRHSYNDPGQHETGYQPASYPRPPAGAGRRPPPPGYPPRPPRRR